MRTAAKERLRHGWRFRQQQWSAPPRTSSSTFSSASIPTAPLALHSLAVPPLRCTQCGRSRCHEYQRRGRSARQRSLALVMAGLANGAAGMFPCHPLVFIGGPSPCPLSPWQDFAHLGGLIFGVSAFVALRKVPVRLGDAHAWLPPAATLVLIVHLGLATAFAI